jgi:uncharacterized membrane protein
MRRRFSPLAVPFACAGLAGAVAADPLFEVIGPVAGTGDVQAHALSADGCIVVGTSGNRAFRWRDGVTTPLFSDPNDGAAEGISADGSVVVGLSNGASAFRLDGSDLEILSLPAGNPHHALAVSADGQAVGGCMHAFENGMHCDIPFFWRNGIGGRALAGLSGAIEFGSVRALSSDGQIAAGSANGNPVVWRPDLESVEGLGLLPGHTTGAVLGLTPDGEVAVGVSSAGTNARAVRWNGSGVLDLGPLTKVARGVSAGGTRIVGDGEDGAFLWDPEHGARLLIDVLRSEYGIELTRPGEEWFLLSALAVTPDGTTIVGHGYDPLQRQVAWRVRLSEDAASCAGSGPGPVIPIPLDNGNEWEQMDAPVALALDGRGWLHVSGEVSRNVGRVHTEKAFLREPLVVFNQWLDFSGDPPPGEGPPDVPVALAAGQPADSLYVGAFARGQLLFSHRGEGFPFSLTEDSWYAPIQTLEGPQRTAPRDVSVGPDGWAYVAANARVLRVQVDQEPVVLLDSAAASLAVHGVASLDNPPFVAVEMDADGRLFVATSDAVFELDPEAGGVLRHWTATALGLAAYGIAGLTLDPDGGLWLHGAGLGRVAPDGSAASIYTPGAIPDGDSGTLDAIRDLVLDRDGNAYYSNGGPVVRRTPSGALSRVLASDTLDWNGEPVGAFAVSDLLLSDDVLYVADRDGDRVLRVELPGLMARCANGRDDDGDGAADFPADAGCISAQDDGERSPRFACDNGVDDDGDGKTDYPADPACGFARGALESTECDDNIDNDGDGAIDWDGGPTEGGTGDPLAPPDPQCGGDPMRVIEHPMYCGLGFEVALLLPVYTTLRRWKRRRR